MLRSSRAFVILAAVAMSTVNFAGPDLWRHLLVGRIVLDTGHLPLHDTFSYTAYGEPWRHREWLAQTVMTLFYAAMGGAGLKLLKFGCAAAMTCLLAGAMDETGAPVRVQRPVLILVALALAPQMQFRPQLFTNLLLTVLVTLMAAETYRGSSRLWIAVPLFAVWANLHGGFVVGLGAIGLYAGVVAARDLWEGRGLGRGARLAAITAGCAATTLLNPFGISAWSNVTRSLTDPFVKESIAEWAPLPRVLAQGFKDWSPITVIYIIPFLLVAALAVYFAIAPELDDVALMAVALMFACSALYAVRNMELAVIAVAIPLTRHAGLVALRWERSCDVGPPVNADRGFNPVLAGALTILLAWTGGLFSPRFRLGLDYPSGAVTFMKEHRIRGNILSSCRWGAYLMCHMGPQSKVFIDERWDLVYPHEVMEEFIRFDRAERGATAVLDDYRNDFVLVPPDSKSCGVVMRDEHWKIIYRDATAVLFARATFTMVPGSTPIKPASSGWFT